MKEPIAYKSTPHMELIKRLLDPNVPKPEIEHAAAKEIEWLREVMDIDMTHMAVLKEYANACDDIQDALLVFVTQRLTPKESADGYIKAPVQEALQKADQIRLKLYQIQGRDLDVSDSRNALRAKLKAITTTEAKK